MKKILTEIALSIALLVACSSNLKVQVKDNITIEYGSELKIEDLTDQKDLRIKEIKDFDGKKTGEQKIKVIFTDSEKEVTKEITLTVKDTKKPEIILNKDKVEITAGDKFDSKSNVKSVKDPVDGDLKYSDKKDLTKDGYQVTGSVDTKKAGNYKLKVVAYDKNGNKAEKEYTVTVKEKSKENNTTSASSGYNAATSNQQASSKVQTPTQSNGSTQPAPKPSKTVCPRTGLEPEDPSLPCDAVLGWGEGDGFYNPHIKFDSPSAANQWADDQMMNNPDYYKNYIGFGSSSLCTNDGYCDWGEVYFYK